MNTARGIPTHLASAASSERFPPRVDTQGVASLFDPPARDDMKLWRQARRARQEWREQRYVRLMKGTASQPV